MLFTKVSPLFLGTAAALMLLSGCAAEDPYAPVEAPEIDSKFDIDKVWADSIGSGVGDFWSALRPDFAAGTVYAASRDGDVFGIVAADGDKIWHTDLSDEEENDSSRSTRLSGGVSAYAGKVAVGSENGYLYLLNAIDGALLWKNYTASELVSRPAFSKSGDRVFVMDHRGRVFAYDCATGEQLWVSGDSPNVLRLRAQSDIVPVGDDFLVMGQSNGKVSVLLQSTGAIVNSLTIAEVTGANALSRVSDVSATPVFDGSDLWVISYNGGMVRTDIYSRDGKFYMVPVYAKDVADKRLPLRACVAHKDEKDWPEMTADYRFLFSLTPDCYVLTEKRGAIREGYYAGMDRAAAAISLSLAEDKQKSIRGIGVLQLDRFEKYVVDRLGRRIRVTRERDPRRS